MLCWGTACDSQHLSPTPMGAKQPFKHGAPDVFKASARHSMIPSQSSAGWIVIVSTCFTKVGFPKPHNLSLLQETPPRFLQEPARCPNAAVPAPWTMTTGSCSWPKCPRSDRVAFADRSGDVKDPHVQLRLSRFLNTRCLYNMGGEARTAHMDSVVFFQYLSLTILR